jgi:hypothetical protein
LIGRRGNVKQQNTGEPTQIRWRIAGEELASCNCNWGCPSQFNALPTKGRCETFVTCLITDGYFANTDWTAWCSLAFTGGHNAQHCCRPAITLVRFSRVPTQRLQTSSVVISAGRLSGKVGAVITSSGQANAFESSSSPFLRSL